MKIRGKGIALIFSVLFVFSHAQWQVVVPIVLLVADVIKWSIDFAYYVKTAHETVSAVGGFGATCSEDESHFQLVTGRVMHAVSDISTHLDEMATLMNDRNRELKKMIRKLGLQIDINMRLDHLVTTMGVIDNLYDDMLRPTKNNKKFDGKQLCRFAHRQIYSEADLLTNKVDAMYNIILPSQHLQTPLLTEIHDNLEDHNNELCGSGHSALDYLHSIYTSVMLVEIRAFVMTAFSHNLLFHFNGTSEDCKYHGMNPNDEIEIAKTKFREHLQEYSNLFLQQMKDASKEFRACDRDDEFIRDETFFELEGAIQAIIYLPPDYPHSLKNEGLVGTEDRCEDLNGSYGTPSFWCNSEKKFCTTPAARNCLGYSLNCKARGEKVYGCIANNSSRRYKWIKDNWNDDVAALWQNCSDPLAIEPWGRHNWYYTKPCHCECNDNNVDSLSTHIFNLQWVESDVSKNMIITGIRFIVEYGIMQFQIKQGTLDSNFRVKEGDWKPIKDISEEIRADRLNKKLRGESPQVVENIDYLIVTQTMNNAIDFDTLTVPHSYVLTGVRFYFPRYYKHGLGNIQIAIKGTKFDHITGKLDNDAPPEIITSTTLHDRKYEYSRTNVNRPIFPTLPKTRTNHYTLLAASDYEHDSGQTTLPYFDAIPLVSNPPVPLGGLGIFHKSAGDFTGFVSLKFVSLDHLTYMKHSMDEIPQQEQILPTPAVN